MAKNRRIVFFIAPAVSLALFSLSQSAFAHGYTPKQAAAAIDVSVDMFLKVVTPEVRQNFLSVGATRIGLEHFEVIIMLKDRITQYKYDCRENEDVDPVVWEYTVI